jgi:hypothetical protein
MNKEFVPYQEALTLQELGFNEPCFATYVGETLDTSLQIPLCNDYFTQAPIFQQAFRFFREKHQVYAEIFVVDDKSFGYLISSFIENGRVDRPMSIGYVFYEEAELYCLRKIIEIVKEKQ